MSEALTEDKTEEYTTEELEKVKTKKSKQSRRSSFGAPPSLIIKSPYEWTANEVAGWIVSLNYTPQSKKFANAMIDGNKLFKLNRNVLQNEVKIFDVTARKEILTAIKNLKKEYKEIQKNKVEQFASTHTRKLEKKKDDAKINDDNPKTRIYMKAKKNSNTSDIGSNYTIENILEHYDFNQELVTDNIDTCQLKYCSLNNDKKKSVFMFQIIISPNKYLYLFTKLIDDWNADNVFEYTKTITNKKFMLLANELKRKKTKGKTFVKYNRQKLQTDYGNYIDAAMRKQMLDEINLLKQQMLNIIPEKPQKTLFHSTHKRSKSEIERDKMKRQKMRKAGPRDVGKIKYSGTKYDDSKDKAFLEDTIHPLSKDEKFQKRKEKSPVPKNATLDEIGKNKYSGTKYDDSNDAGFLADRINPLSKDAKFQKRKQLNPAKTKEKVSDIGTVHGFKGTKYDDSNDAGFLADRINPLSKDEKFQKRKEANPVKSKEKVADIGTVHGFKGTKYDDSNDAGFLADSVHPLSKDERFLQRKEKNPVQKSQTVVEIGKNKEFKGPDWKLEDVVDKDAFLSDDAYYRQRTEFITKDSDGTVQQKLGPMAIGKVQGFKKPEWSEQVEQEMASGDLFAEKIKKEDKDYEELAKLNHKAGAVEVGKIKNFDAIDYKMSKDESMGNPLADRAWYDSSKVHEAFDEGISHMLKSLPSHKLRIMDDVPLPTGFATKIQWLKRLREVIEGELKKGNLKKQQTQMQFRQEQLDQLNALIETMEDKNVDKGKRKKKKKSKKKNDE